MRIGFDAKRAAQNRTGLGNYSRFVINGLAKYAMGNKYLLYVPSERKATLLGRLWIVTEVCLPKGLWRLFGSLWRVWGIGAAISRDGVALYHGLSGELPMDIGRARQTKSIVTIHDLIFLRYPQYFHYIDRKIYAYKFRRACQEADRIIAVSECTKRDVIAYFGIAEEKIEVVYQGCDPTFGQEASAEVKAEVRQKYNLPEKYVLYVGSIEARKNLMLVARALKHMDEDICLVAIGKRTPYAKQVERYLHANGLEGRVRMLSNIPFGELPAFYQMARVFVYPSLFEGFGIPMLEALNSGVPAIGATGSCLEEAGGPGSLYIDPNDEEGLAEAIEKIWNDEVLRRKMIAQGREYACLFEEAKLTADMINVYRRTMEV